MIKLVVCVQLSTLNFATALVHWIDFGFNQNDNTSSYSRRVPCILQCIFLIPMMLIVLILPKTPRWLAAHNRQDESLEVLRRLRRAKEEDKAIAAIHKDIVARVIWKGRLAQAPGKTYLRMTGSEANEGFLPLAPRKSFSSWVV